MNQTSHVSFSHTTFSSFFLCRGWPGGPGGLTRPWEGLCVGPWLAAESPSRCGSFSAGEPLGALGQRYAMLLKQRWYILGAKMSGGKIQWTMIWCMIYRSHKSIKIWKHFWQNLSIKFDAALILSIPSFQIQEPDATMLDVRSPQEFAQGHLPGAKNLPLFSWQD